MVREQNRVDHALTDRADKDKLIMLTITSERVVRGEKVVADRAAHRI